MPIGRMLLAVVAGTVVCRRVVGRRRGAGTRRAQVSPTEIVSADPVGRDPAVTDSGDSARALALEQKGRGLGDAGFERADRVGHIDEVGRDTTLIERGHGVGTEHRDTLGRKDACRKRARKWMDKSSGGFPGLASDRRRDGRGVETAGDDPAIAFRRSLVSARSAVLSSVIAVRLSSICRADRPYLVPLGALLFLLRSALADLGVVRIGRRWEREDIGRQQYALPCDPNDPKRYSRQRRKAFDRREEAEIAGQPPLVIRLNPGRRSTPARCQRRGCASCKTRASWR